MLAEGLGEGIGSLPPDRAAWLKGAMITQEGNAIREGDYVGAVNLLYLDVLGRKADEDGQRDYSAQLQGGTPLGELRKILATSDEFREKAKEKAETDREAAVGGLYLSILGREMDGDGRAAYVTNPDMPIDEIIDSMVGSDEYRDRFLTVHEETDEERTAQMVPVEQSAPPQPEHAAPPPASAPPEHRPVPPAAREADRPEQPGRSRWGMPDLRGMIRRRDRD